MTNSSKPPDPLTSETDERSNRPVIESVPIDLVKIPANQVKPPSAGAIALCKGNMRRFEQPLPILVSGDYTVIVGLEFFYAAKEMGWPRIDVIRRFNLTDTEFKIHVLWLAKLPFLSSWDNEALRFEFQDIISLDPELIDLTGFSMGEIDVILDEAASEMTPDPLDNIQGVSPDGEIVSMIGDIFILGDHKVICGDSQIQENIDLLMEGEKARAVITDPPWNILIENNVSGLGKKKHKNFAMAVGEMSFDEFQSFLSKMLLLSINVLISGGLIYVFMDRRHLEELFAAARHAKLKLFDLAIWDKESGSMGSFYRSQFEACGIFKLDNGPHLNHVQLGKDGRNRTNLWKHRGLSSFGKGRAEALAMHPTVKPVNLVSEIIKDCTNRGDVILDPFLGSGTAILAAQKTGRRCFGIELERIYIDVAIRRWEKMTGEQAVHARSGLTFVELQLQRLGQQEAPLLLDATSDTEADNAE